MIEAASAEAALRWYFVSLAVSLTLLPVAAFIRPGRGGEAWALARIGAWPLVAWIAWIAHAAGAPWGRTSVAIGLVGMAALSLVVLARSPRVRRMLRRPRGLPGAELLYLAVFLMVLWSRTWQPNLEGLEKFMDGAFINAVYHAASLPAPDPWFAGAPINYYYFGHLSAAVACLVTGVAPDTGYNLMFSHVFAAAGLGAGAAVAGLVTRATRQPLYAGIVGALAAVTMMIGGNLHSVVFGVIRPALADLGLMAAPAAAYFYPQSSRLIGHSPNTADKTITEFPGYSVTVGDLHAHVLNLPIAAALLLLALALPLGRRAGWSALGPRASGPRRAQAVAYGAALAALLAWCGMANSWDVPIYLTVIGVLLIAAARGAGTGWLASLAGAGTACALLLALAVAGSAMFWRHFVPFGQGVEWVRYGSPWWQLALLYGNYVLVAVVGLFMVAGQPGPDLARERVVRAVAGMLVASLVILAVPETIFVKDLYGEDWQRANTMFKMSYQLYLLLPVAAFAMGAIAVAAARRTLVRLATALGYTLLCVSPLVFVPLVHTGGVKIALSRAGHLDGLRFLKPGDAEAVRFLEAHRPAPGEAMLEASGDSYTYAARLSAATGIPTVLGWHVHEWLWRKDLELWRRRADEIGRFYREMTEAERRAFLARYGVRYVVVGAFERERYAGLDVDQISRLGRVVFDVDGTRIVDVLPAGGPRATP